MGIVGKIRRGNYLFVSWVGDHGRHVHVFRNRRQVVKWDLDENCVIEGRATRKIKALIAELVREGRL